MRDQYVNGENNIKLNPQVNARNPIVSLLIVLHPPSSFQSAAAALLIPPPPFLPRDCRRCVAVAPPCSHSTTSSTPPSQDRSSSPLRIDWSCSFGLTSNLVGTGHNQTHTEQDGSSYQKGQNGFTYMIFCKSNFNRSRTRSGEIASAKVRGSEYKISYIAREGNKAADLQLLAKSGAVDSEVRVYDGNSATANLKEIVQLDQQGLPNFRFRKEESGSLLRRKQTVP
ncbi:hypothetical protein AAHA92_22403 [Salvia divinorum]|uniref:Uncharacterized protein n=1 Tax=Salvia divinorum TaxID=28513 RepID=A0ABD1GS76_SALDI